MTATAEFLDRSIISGTVTVSGLRDLLTDLAPDVEVHVGVWDSNQFNVLIGTLPVSAARMTPATGGGYLLFRVPGIS